MVDLVDAISQNLVLIDKDLSQEKKIKDSTEDSLYESLLTSVKNIPFIKYQAWIPNNGGLLSWSRIGVEYEAKKRYSFKPNLFTKDYQAIAPIEVVDTDIDINDVVSFLNIDKSLKPIFITKVEFKKVTDEVLGLTQAVINGQGHSVENGVYECKSILAFYSKEIYKKLINQEIEKKLKNMYSVLNQDEYIKCYEELKNFLLNNNACHAFSVSYKIQSKGKIELDPICILFNSENDLIIESICSQEGYKQLVQLLYGQIKKVFHGDSHHHHKDDVILKVYNGEDDNPMIPLKQMVEHMKGLEKIEKNRHKIECNEFIPSYVHEADGIVAYAEMYYENYIASLKDENIKKEGERFLKASKAIHKSLKSVVDRNNDAFDLTKSFKKKGRNIATETSTYIFLFAFLAFILKGNTTIDSAKSDILSYIIIAIGFIMEVTFFLVMVVSLIFVFMYKNKFDLCICKIFYLHRDLRPKDKYYAHYLNKNSKKSRFYNTIELFLVTTTLCALIAIIYYFK